MIPDFPNYSSWSLWYDEHDDEFENASIHSEEVDTNIGKIPVVDFLDIFANQHGFDGFEDMFQKKCLVPGYEDVVLARF